MVRQLSHDQDQVEGEEVMPPVAEDEPAPRVFIQHIRQSGYCMNGARDFWARHNLSWQDFLDNGIDGQILLDTQDPRALAPIKFARLNGNGR